MTEAPLERLWVGLAPEHGNAPHCDTEAFGSARGSNHDLQSVWIDGEKVSIKSRMVSGAKRQAIPPVVRAFRSLAPKVSSLDELRMRDRTYGTPTAIPFEDMKAELLLVRANRRSCDPGWVGRRSAERAR